MPNQTNDGTSHVERVICSKSLADTRPETQYPKRETLIFDSPKRIARLANEYNPPFFSPGSSFAIITNGSDDAALSLMLTLACSCAKQGASILLLSRTTRRDQVADWLFQTGPGLSKPGKLTRTDMKLLDKLDFHVSPMKQSHELTEEELVQALEISDADLVVVEDGTPQELWLCTEIAQSTGIPLLYNLEAKRGRKRMFCKSIKPLPSYILLMDRSHTEEEAEKPNRPCSLERECRLLVPNSQNQKMDLSFEGMFILYYSRREKRIYQVIDEYGGHLLWGEIERLDIGKNKYPIAEPPDYEEKLRAANDWG